MINDVMPIVLAAAPSFLTGFVLAVFSRRQKTRDAAKEEREENAELSAELQLSLLVAAAQLSYAVAMAVKRGHPNGEVEDGIECYREAMEKFREHERRQLARIRKEE